MEQFNAAVFYQLGRVLEASHAAIVRLAPIGAAYNPMVAALQILEFVSTQSPRYRLEDSATFVPHLTAVMEGAIQRLEANHQERFTEDDRAKFHSTMESFQSTLAAELSRAPIFYIFPKGVFDTKLMTMEGERVYGRMASRISDDALRDTKAAARCLAFDLHTAAGFHIARATEAVMKQLMQVLGCPPLKESQRNWGQYIKALRDKEVSEKIAYHLEKLKDLHRNPLIHPDQTLNELEAQTLWALCTSIIMSMVAEMESKREVQDPEILAFNPPNAENTSA